TTGAGGPVGTVSLLNLQGRSTSTLVLPASAYRIVGGTVDVTVPTKLLPASNPASSRFGVASDSYAFTAGVPGSSGTDIAGFAPEYSLAKIDAPGIRRP